MTKDQFMASIEDLHQNPLEVRLRSVSKLYPYSLKLIDVYPVYCFEKQKYICYRKELKEEQQLLIIQEHIDSPAYKWKENAYFNTISLYYFMNIKKNKEWFASWGLSINKGIENGYPWKIWGVLEDGTILNRRETRKIMKLLQSNANKSNANGGNNMEGLDEDEAREIYIDSLAEGDSYVW